MHRSVPFTIGHSSSLCERLDSAERPKYVPSASDTAEAPRDTYAAVRRAPGAALPALPAGAEVSAGGVGRGELADATGGGGAGAAAPSGSSSGTTTFTRAPRFMSTVVRHGFLPGAVAWMVHGPGSTGSAVPHAPSDAGSSFRVIARPRTRDASGTSIDSRGSARSSSARRSFAKASRASLPSRRAIARACVSSPHAVASRPSFS